VAPFGNPASADPRRPAGVAAARPDGGAPSEEQVSASFTDAPDEDQLAGAG